MTWPATAGLSMCVQSIPDAPQTLAPAAASAQDVGDTGLDDPARVGYLVRTIERAVIPRLVQARRPAGSDSPGLPPAPGALELQTFVSRILHGREADMQGQVMQLRRSGVSVSDIYLHLLAPAARTLGSLWDQDLCDFPGVTVGLGRLQRLLRELSEAFEAEAPPADPTRAAGAGELRVLLAQAPREQHSFGLSMVAAYFRRAGWIVEGGIGGSEAAEPALRAQADWFDAVGFSIGSQVHLPWLQEQVRNLRLLSRNPHLAVLVGGPLVLTQPACAQQAGADACITDASQAPGQAALLALRSSSER